MAEKESRLKDGPDRYGWISIALHWISACVIFTLWFIGDSIGARGAPSFDETVRAHTTIALGFYALLWARAIWRFKYGHPKPSPHHSKTSFLIGNIAHYLMMTCLAVMLVSGPIMAWSGGIPLRIFDWRIAAPFPINGELFAFAHSIHVTAASILIWTILLHITGVVKHLVIDHDGTFDRIMVPEAVPDRGSAAKTAEAETEAKRRS
jgi:cytochrome b561